MGKSCSRAISAWLALLLVITGCGSQQAAPLTKSEPFEPLEVLKLPGWEGALDGDRLITKNDGELTVTDLNTHKQLTTISVKQAAGFDISGNMVVWSDLRNEVYNNSYKGDVFVHDTDTGETLRVTDMDVDQRTPVISGHIVAWMDERNGSSTHDVGPGPHNSDIYLADLEKSTETLITGDGPQISPLISDHWIVYGKSSDVEADLTAVRYR